MTQQPYYPPQPYAPAPPQQYAPPAPAYYAPQYPAAPPQQYGAPAPAAPAQPVAAGTIDDFYNQPSAAGGPGISWKDKPLGTSYAGIISREPRVQQDTDFDTGQPLFQKDRVTPKWVMLLPLTVQPSPEFPDGEVVFYVRGQARDELVRAMAESGCSGGPKVGAGLQVTLVQRKPNRKGNPSNIVQIRYAPPGGVAHNEVPQQDAAPAPAAPSPVAGTEQVPQPVPAQPPVQQYAPPPAQAPVQQQYAPQQVPAPAAPAQVAQAPTPQPPANLTPEQQELLAKLTA